MRAIYEPAVQGPGARHLEAVESAQANLDLDVRLQQQLAEDARLAAHIATVDPTAMQRSLEALHADVNGSLERVIPRCTADLSRTLGDAKAAHIAQAVAGVASQVQAGAESQVNFAAPELRLVLREGYDRITTSLRGSVEDLFRSAADEVVQAFWGNIGMDRLAIEPPPVPAFPAPIVLGKTIVIDLDTSWWKRLWQRRQKPDAMAAEYAALVDAEIGS